MNLSVAELPPVPAPQDLQVTTVKREGEWGRGMWKGGKLMRGGGGGCGEMMPCGHETRHLASAITGLGTTLHTEGAGQLISY